MRNRANGIAAAYKYALKALKHRPFSEWTVILWMTALFLAVFGFSGLAGTAGWIVQVLAVVFAVLFLSAAILFRSNPH